MTSIGLPEVGEPVVRQPVLAGPVRRILRMARPLRGSILLAAAAGSATVACGVALLTVSAFLLARAAQHPNITALSIAVVAVRALGIGRGAFRYVERLSTHDAAFRLLADLRARIYSRLEHVVPGGLPGMRSGDLLTRLVSDVDAVQDLFVRGITPPLVAALVGAAATTAAELSCVDGSVFARFDLSVC